MTPWTGLAWGGWIMVVWATTKREATQTLRAYARGASLLPSDVHTIRPATEEERLWYCSMGGGSA